MRTLSVLAALSLPLVGCGPTLARTVHWQHFDENTGTLWVIEHDATPRTADEIRVIVCHREAHPACIRHIPPEARSVPEYAAWLNSLPTEVRRLATLPPPAPAASAGPAPAAAPVTAQ